MPTYLCHGFRWDRRSIRVFVVVQNIDDAAPEWIIAPNSSPAILESFYSLFDFLPEPPSDDTDAQQKKKRSKSKPPKAGVLRNEYDVPPSTVPPEEDDVLQNSWSAVKLLEEYDPTDLSYVSRPYAYVADHVVRVDLSNSITEEIMRYEERLGETKAMASAPSDEYLKAKKGSTSGKKAGWFEKLRDQLQRGEDIRWYVVVCGDEVRDFPEDTSTLKEPQPREEVSREADRETSRARDRSAGPSSRSGAPTQEYVSSVPASQFASAMSPQQPQVSPKEAGLPYGTLFQHPNMYSDTPTPALLQPKPSMDFRPKTPKGGGFRRLFGKKADEP
ncbi:developmental regulator [Colletotrichum plurivorum]|uniref:Developmental regulator n=1 Tax=Colletotrichum plurivorum TaxID=2175906 RepID=A0A8H6NQV9_9PEZI|nr:developmental regulator [Colletotrichum plurivorum]